MAAIQHLVRFMVWLPLGGVILALVAWGLRRAPLPWYVGGLSLLLWLTMITAYYAPFSVTPQCIAERITLTPHKDPDSPTGIYIPATLDEAISEFDRTVPACAVPKILDAGPDTFHLSLGMWIRNNWGLWHGSRLAQHFNAMGIDHPDDMSGIILTSYWRRLKNRPINLKEQVALYQAYWRFVGDSSLGSALTRQQPGYAGC